MLGLIGKKVGMTQVFDANGRLTPVTVIKIEDNVVIANRTEEKNGYSAAVLGTGAMKKSTITKPYAGQFKDIEVKKTVMEFRDFDNEVAVGDVLGVDLFKDVTFVDVTGTSKGKGYNGTIVRNNAHQGPKSHGGSKNIRHIGSLATNGITSRQGRIMKGTIMAGQEGGYTTTNPNLTVIKVDKENNYLLIKGNVPGPKKGLVMVRTAKTSKGDKEPVTLIDYSATKEVQE